MDCDHSHLDAPAPAAFRQRVIAGALDSAQGDVASVEEATNSEHCVPSLIRWGLHVRSIWLATSRGEGLLGLCFTARKDREVEPEVLAVLLQHSQGLLWLAQNSVLETLSAALAARQRTVVVTRVQQTS